MMCQACKVMKLGKDINPMKGAYAVEIAWGKNTESKSGTSQFWQGFEAYKVIIVDTLGNFVGDVDNGGIVTVKNVDSNGASVGLDKDCCRETEYSTTVSGQVWPAGGKRFMIVPLVNYGKTAEYSLPVGSMTTEFADSEEGSTTQITIEPIFTMPQDAALQFLQSSNRWEIARATVHAGLAKQGVLLKSIIVKDILMWQKNNRRLASGRRLSEYGIKIQSEILLDNDYKGGAIETKDVDQTAMKETLVSKANDAGLTKLTSEAVAIKADSVAVVSKELAPDVATTGGAQPLPGPIFSTMIAMVFASVSHQVLA